jgi:hypothetical protein
VKFEDVTVKCGHVERFDWFEDRKDKYRDARRLKLQARDCRQCRAAKQAAIEQQAAQRRTQKRQDLPQRLPDGATFHTVYSAASQTWTGSLTINLDGK